MTMLTSLKALLATRPGVPPKGGGSAGAVHGDGATDFASLMGSMRAEAGGNGATSAAVHPPMSLPLTTNDTAPDGSHQGVDTPTLPLAGADIECPVKPAAQAVIPSDNSQPDPSDISPQDEQAPMHHGPTMADDKAPTRSESAATVNPTPAIDVDGSDEDEDKGDGDLAVEVDRPHGNRVDHVAGQPVVVPPLSPMSPAADAVATPDTPPPSNDVAAVPHAALQTTPPTTPPTTPYVDTPSLPDAGAAPTAPASAGEGRPAMAGQGDASTAAALIADATTTYSPSADDATTIPSLARPGDAPSGAPVTPVPGDGAVMADRPAAGAKGVEALSLLQFVRDQFAGRGMAVRVATDAAPAADDSAQAMADAAPAPLDMQAISVVQPLSQPQAPSAAPHIATALPVVDLSASLGAQVVDMGVSGQWIDGLARDIAGLSANGAQGRFQINANHLGPVQVDIRQTEGGATASLTVSSDMAAAALRQDGDHLRLDPGPSGVRISDVKVERAAQPGETAASSQQRSGDQPASQQQQQGSNGQSAAWQGQGQGAGQSQGQARWQMAENIANGHKAGADPVVLHPADADDVVGRARRARYA